MTDEPGAEIRRRFAENFRAAREASGLSGVTVAERMRERGFSFHQQTISRIEAAEQPVPVEVAEHLADIVGTTVPDLMRRTELAEEAARIRSLSRKVRQSRDEIRALTRRHDADAERLRELIEAAGEKGTAAELAGEIRAAMFSLGDGRPRGSGPDNAGPVQGR